MINIEEMIKQCGRHSRLIKTETLLCMLRDTGRVKRIPLYVEEKILSKRLDFKTLYNFTNKYYTAELVELYIRTNMLRGKYNFKNINWLEAPIVSKRLGEHVGIYHESIALYHWLLKHTDEEVIRGKRLNKNYIRCFNNHHGVDEHKDLFIYFDLMRTLNYNLNLPGFFIRAIQKNVDFSKYKESFLRIRFADNLIIPFIAKKIYGLPVKADIQCRTKWSEFPLGLKWTDGDYQIDICEKVKEWCNDNIYFELKELPKL